MTLRRAVVILCLFVLCVFCQRINDPSGLQVGLHVSRRASAGPEAQDVRATAIVSHRHNPGRKANVRRIVQEYHSVPQVDEIIVALQGPHSARGLQVLRNLPKVRFAEILEGTSAAGRWNVSVQTEAVFMNDDDVLTRAPEIEAMLSVWAKSPDCLVGVEARLAHRSYYQGAWMSDPSENIGFNMLLPWTLLFNRKMLTLYNSDTHREQRELVVSQVAHCDDVLFNMLHTLYFGNVSKFQLSCERGLCSQHLPEGDANLALSKGTNQQTRMQDRGACVAELMDSLHLAERTFGAPVEVVDATGAKVQRRLESDRAREGQALSSDELQFTTAIVITSKAETNEEDVRRQAVSTVRAYQSLSFVRYVIVISRNDQRKGLEEAFASEFRVQVVEGRLWTPSNNIRTRTAFVHFLHVPLPSQATITSMFQLAKEHTLDGFFVEDGAVDTLSFLGQRVNSAAIVLHREDLVLLQRTWGRFRVSGRDRGRGFQNRGGYRRPAQRGSGRWGGPQMWKQDRGGDESGQWRQGQNAPESGQRQRQFRWGSQTRRWR